jgi:zinc transport system ATP-binding protein
MSAVLVRATGLGAVPGGHRVLKGIDLAIHAGEIVTVVGPNGSGKSTLLRLLIGAQAPDEGRVERPAGLRIGYVPQRLAIDSTLPITVGRFLGLAGGNAGERDKALARVGIAGLGRRQMADLSGGQFQRALLAQALLRRPQLMVLDEAAQGLDQAGVAGFYRLVEEIRGELGCGVLMVSHDLHVVMAASDRVICLNGHVCCEGTPTVVSAAPEYRALFGLGTQGALALYRHEHDHSHGEDAGGHRHHHADEPAA